MSMFAPFVHPLLKSRVASGALVYISPYEEVPSLAFLAFSALVRSIFQVKKLEEDVRFWTEADYKSRKTLYNLFRHEWVDGVLFTHCLLNTQFTDGEKIIRFEREKQIDFRHSFKMEKFLYCGEDSVVSRLGIIKSLKWIYATLVYSYCAKLHELNQFFLSELYVTFVCTEWIIGPDDITFLISFTLLYNIKPAVLYKKDLTVIPFTQIVEDKVPLSSVISDLARSFPYPIE